MAISQYARSVSAQEVRRLVPRQQAQGHDVAVVVLGVGVVPQVLEEPPGHLLDHPGDGDRGVEFLPGGGVDRLQLPEHGTVLAVYLQQDVEPQGHAERDPVERRRQAGVVGHGGFEAAEGLPDLIDREVDLVVERDDAEPSGVDLVTPAPLVAGFDERVGPRPAADEHQHRGRLVVDRVGHQPEQPAVVVLLQQLAGVQDQEHRPAHRDPLEAVAQGVAEELVRVRDGFVRLGPQPPLGPVGEQPVPPEAAVLDPQEGRPALPRVLGPRPAWPRMSRRRLRPARRCARPWGRQSG